ncbi:MAG TPA: LapA family protein [Solirubrobacteraceae bacterium]|nr:LapA family protein [Solirubrobacteraceae bacterium]
MSDPSDEQREPGRAAAARDNARMLAAAILGGAGAVFAVLNLDEVEVNWIFGSGQTPLILVISVSLLLGFALGMLLARRRAKR